MVGDFWCRRSMQKGDSWQALFFSIFLFSCLKSHRCFYIFLRRNVSTHASAVFAKHWHVRTEGHINRNFYCCGARNFWRKILVHALSIFFFIPETFENIEKASPVYVCRWQKFSTSRRDTSPSFGSPQKVSSKKISGRYNAVLRNLPETFCQRNQELQLNGQKGLTTFFFNWNSRLLKYFLWKSKMHFRKPRWKFCSRMLNSG